MPCMSEPFPVIHVLELLSVLASYSVPPTTSFQSSRSRRHRWPCTSRNTPLHDSPRVDTWLRCRGMERCRASVKLQHVFAHNYVFADPIGAVNKQANFFFAIFA